MANKKKKRSNSYWMKFGGATRKMYRAGGDSTGDMGNMMDFDFSMDNAMGSGFNFATGNSLNPEYVEFNPTYVSSGSGTTHHLNGSLITPTNPQHVPGHQLGTINSTPSRDYVYPYQKKKPIRFYENGGNPGNNITKDPTFKMWFGRNANRADVMQSSSDPASLKKLFLNDINFPGNEAPIFSGEIDGFGNVDKSNRSTEVSSKLLNRKYGGMPKAANGYYSSNNQTDYSGVNDRNTNMGTGMQTVGDSNALQYLDYVVPGLGSGLDFLVDLWGFKGEQKQFADNSADANESQSTLDVIDRKNANKGTLDLSTRKDALGAMVNFTQQEPTFGNYMAPRMMQTIGAGLGRYAMSEGAGMLGGGAGGGELGDAVSPVQLNPGDALAKFGGEQGQMEKAAFGRGGGAFNLGPGVAGMPAMSSRNPYGQGALMAATGMAGEQAFEAGGPASAEQYEAEGNEVIMHEPGNQPGTTGDMEAIEGNEMLSKLHGKSHDDGGEVVEGDGEQYVFSDKLKSDKWGNITFADAAEKIAKNIAKYESSLEDGDDITKSTAEAMIQAWQVKLEDLRGEQEQARQEKFIEMVNSGASKDELMQNFPDLTEQMMAEEAMAAQGGQEEQMPQDNPMGNIDMSQLSPEDQQLIGARYGLPHMNHGGSHDGFDPFDFNSYASSFTDEGLFYGKTPDFNLDKKYQPNRKDLVSLLTSSFPIEGEEFQGKTYLNADDLADAYLTDYNTQRSAHIEDATGLKVKPRRKDYKSTDETTGKTSVDKVKLQQDKAAWSMYNSGLSGNWSENFGADANMSPRKYFKTFYNDLISKGTDPELAATLLEKEKMQKAELDAANLELEAQKKELTPEQQAAALIEERQSWNKNKKLLGDIGNTMVNMAPTMYNFMKGNEDAEVEQFQGNKNDEEIQQILDGLSKKDISQELEQNEETFNNLKYLARDASDGSSANAMNTLLRGMVFKQDADAAAYESQHESNQQNKTLMAEFLSKSGDADRKERIRVAGINSENRAAVEAFTAKGWEGLSGANQMRMKLQNQVNHDETLKGLLDDIYPDVHKYKTETGGVDLEALIKAHPELAKELQDYFKNAK
mgnify:CR=1 FL=1|tara:strand:- start:29443 stop:32700 length:3258 start_codon:yes stop_codon:yes gene_type:complete